MASDAPCPVLFDGACTASPTSTIRSRYQCRTGGMMCNAPVTCSLSAVVRAASSPPGTSPAYVSRSLRSQSSAGISRAWVSVRYSREGRLAPQTTPPSAPGQYR